MQTAIVGIIGALVGVLLTNIFRVALDWQARRERVRDVQTSLRAEIRSHRQSLEIFVDAARRDATIALIEADAGYVPFIPHEVEPFIFEAMVGDIQVLPGTVIDPVVLYYRQWRAISALAEDMRGAQFAALAQYRKAALYADYVAMGVYAVDLAKDAVDAINRSLRAEEAA